MIVVLCFTGTLFFSSLLSPKKNLTKMFSLLFKIYKSFHIAKEYVAYANLGKSQQVEIKFTIKLDKNQKR